MNRRKSRGFLNFPLPCCYQHSSVIVRTPDLHKNDSSIPVMSHENMLRVPLHGQSLGCSTTIHFLTLKRPEMILKMLWGTLRCSLIASAFPSTLYHNTQLWDLV